MERLSGFISPATARLPDEDGYIVMGRTDDVINVAAIVWTGRIEEVVAEHPAVAECAVVGIADAEKGQVPVGLLLMKDGINQDFGALQDELVRQCAALWAIANFKRAIVVPGCRKRDQANFAAVIPR